SVTLGGGAGGTQIRNVAAGTLPNHAVNKQQLDDEVAANKLRFVSVNSNTGANQDNEGATGDHAIAIGAGAFGKAHFGTAVGQGAWAGLAENSIGATAIGTMARAQRAHGT